ncbi:MAG: hypothetical protein LBT37_07555 [Lactobacillaceae bacterium]|jgi:hypothetical protein|nr:hypothetical protein [Lactobacillaceae bacterium]
MQDNVVPSSKDQYLSDDELNRVKTHYKNMLVKLRWESGLRLLRRYYYIELIVLVMAQIFLVLYGISAFYKISEGSWNGLTLFVSYILKNKGSLVAIKLYSLL